MLRILHLTDFHLNPQNLKDWENYVKPALISKLKQIGHTKSIDLVAFTGDMLDKGGAGYSSASEAFEVFKREIIDPLISSIGLDNCKFLMIPGNHDVIRDQDDEPTELGFQQWFKKNYSNVTKFISDAVEKKNYNGIKRMLDYKHFEKMFYQNCKDANLTVFGSSFRFDIQGSSIGVCCLNSAWRCYGASNDKEKLLIGEEQLISNTKFVSKCDVKIALMHHPLDWLCESERQVMSSHISKDFDILLLGHVHENQTSMHTGFRGTLFTNMAPSGLNDIRSDSRTFANGFSVIDFDKIKGEVGCEYFRYNHNSKSYVLNTDAGIGGSFHQKVPTSDTLQNKDLCKNALAWIKETHFKEMDEHLLGHRAEMSITTIKEAFVFPPIDKGNNSTDEEEAPVSISEIIKTKSDLMFFATQEAGKTTFLYRLVREFVDEYDYVEKVPVYIDFEEIGNKDIQTCIKDYLKLSSTEVDTLVMQGKIVLLIDNLNYKEGITVDRTNRLQRFLEGDGRAVLVIATAENDMRGILPANFLNICNIPFKSYFIKSLKAKEIKSLMKLWLPNEDELQSEQRLDKMVTSFNSYSLPSTAMSVSLFLWSMENKERKPINHAVLMEIYIEILLEKLSKDNIYRGKFDFTNKVQLLAKIAEEMLVLEKPSYSLSYAEFVKIVEDYLKKEVGFDFDTEVIVKYFLDRKLFVRYQGTRVKFAYSCYFHFFVAQRMKYQPEFREYIWAEDKYFKFTKEIDYYTALVRSDKVLLTEIIERFEKRFVPLNFILTQVNIDDYFTPVPISDKPFEPLTEKLEINKIVENRPSQQMIEEFHNKRLEAVAQPSEILKKEGVIALDTLLILMSNILRNSEGVEDINLKRKGYGLLVKYSQVFMILYKEDIARYVILNKKLPPWMPIGSSLEYHLKNIPLFVQAGMNHHLGTPKLASIIQEKIKSDEVNQSQEISDIEEFLSVGLYADVYGSNYEKYLKRLIKRVNSNVVRDYILYKLIDYYNKRTRPGSENEQKYLDLIADLKLKTERLPKKLKAKVLKLIEGNKKSFKEKPKY